MAFKQIVLVSAVLAITMATIPSYIKVCKSTDPDVSNCIKTSIEGIREKLAAGIEELHVPPVEPFNIPLVVFKNSPHSNLTDLVIDGLTGFVIDEFKAEIDKTRFAAVVTLPKIKLVSNYNVDLKILVAQIKGAGKLTADFDDLKATLLLKGRKFDEGGKTFLRFDPVKVEIIFGKSNIKLANLFTGQRALGDATNDLINESPEAFLSEIKDSLEEGVSGIFTNIANKITTHFTYDELFPSE